MSRPRETAGSARTAPSARTLIDLVRGLGRPRVLVVGDLMLDQYVFGACDRPNQEAPVPLLRVERREARAGGAANVGLMLARLEAEVVLVGVVGDDRAGARLIQLLRRPRMCVEAVTTDTGRPTTRKRRYVDTAGPGAPRQVLRVDVEVRDPLHTSIEAQLLKAIETRLPECDIVLVSDYDKGVAGRALLGHLIGAARASGRPVLVDPPRLTNYARYHGASCLTPNRVEAGLAAGLEVDSPGRAFQAGEELLRQTKADAIIVTLDEQGMALIGADGRREHHPIGPCAVRDPIGAGDAVLSVLGLCLACGIDYGPAVALGNIAGGLTVERWGVARLRRADLVGALSAPAGPMLIA